MARVHNLNDTCAHTTTHFLLCRSVRAKQQLDSNWWLDPRDSHRTRWLDTMIESLNKEKLVISRQTLSAFPQTTLQNALDKLFKHVDKHCLHCQIVQTSPVDILCRQTFSAKNPPKTVDKLCLHFCCRQPLQRCVDEQECRRPRPEGRQSLSA